MGRGVQVDSVATFRGQAFRAPEASPLLVLPRGHTVLLPEVAWEFDDSTPTIRGEGLLQGAVLDVGAGRVAVFGEAAMFTAQVAGAARAPAGMNHPAAGGNARFVRNVVGLLADPIDPKGAVALRLGDPKSISVERRRYQAQSVYEHSCRSLVHRVLNEVPLQQMLR